MALITVKEIFTPPPKGWAIGAFNVHNLEDVQAVVWAASELESPVIIQVSESAYKYAGGRLYQQYCQSSRPRNKGAHRLAA
jgi:fructose-bisphosphate aldolase class II